MLKQPNEDHFKDDMNKLDAKVADLRDQKNDLMQKRREIMEGGKVKGSSMTYREVLTGKINDLKKI